MRTTNPPEFEPEGTPQTDDAAEPVVGSDEASNLPSAASSVLEASPESTLRHDVYINKKFAAIFEYEDRSGALAHAFEKSLSVNDNGAAAPVADGLVAWFRAVREAGK